LRALWICLRHAFFKTNPRYLEHYFFKKQVKKEPENLFHPTKAIYERTYRGVRVEG